MLDVHSISKKLNIGSLQVKSGSITFEVEPAILSRHPFYLPSPLIVISEKPSHSSRHFLRMNSTNVLNSLLPLTKCLSRRTVEYSSFRGAARISGLSRPSLGACYPIDVF